MSTRGERDPWSVTQVDRDFPVPPTVLVFFITRPPVTIATNGQKPMMIATIHRPQNGNADKAIWSSTKANTSGASRPNTMASAHVRTSRRCMLGRNWVLSTHHIPGLQGYHNHSLSPCHILRMLPISESSPPVVLHATCQIETPPELDGTSPSQNGRAFCNKNHVIIDSTPRYHILKQ